MQRYAKILLLAMTACSSKLHVTSKGSTDANALAAACDSATDKANCPYIQITTVDKIIVKPSDIITLTGQKFSPRMTVTTGLSLTSPLRLGR